MNYNGIDSKYAIEKLAAGSVVVVCDLDTKRVLDCGELTVNQIMSYMTKRNAKFFEGKPNEQA